MKKIDSTAEESKELAAIMQAQPQVEQKTKYFKNLLLAQDELHTAIQERINIGYTVSKAFVLGFIPIKIKTVLDTCGIARLKVELQEVENKAYSHQQYYEHWLKASKNYESKMDGITRECNQQFDFVLDKAKKINHNPRLDQVITNYVNKDNDQQLKNQYYLILKQEVNNFEVHGVR